MPLTKLELFNHVHSIVKCANVAYFGGYRKCFAHYLKRDYEQKLVRSWAV